MKKKLILLIIIALLIASSSFSIYKKIMHKKYVDNVLIQLSIQDSAYSYTYCFVVTKDKKLSVSFGERKDNNIKRIPFLKEVKENGEKILTNEEFKHLITLASQLNKSGDDVGLIVSGSWDIYAFYQQTTYSADYYLGKNEKLQELAKEFINVSPIPIVLKAGAVKDLRYINQLNTTK